ncbi:MAG TPA: AprI/Inh family metalloprotease inhibitor [Devosia sp.]|nr:AprI/Inh family metalloprotease inhibitor [Devosia sp.]
MTLVGCASSSNTAGLNTIQAPSTLRPVQGSTVAQGTLPAIGATGTPAPGLSGQPVLGGIAAQPTTGFGTLPPVQGSTVQTATYNGTLVPLTQPGAVSAGPEGVWTVIAGTNQCRLNLPLTLKDGANYYRASAPGCGMPTLSTIAGWQQVGQQLQLYDVNGNIAGSLVPSGGRYIGTLSGGVGITMQR